MAGAYWRSAGHRSGLISQPPGSFCLSGSIFCGADRTPLPKPPSGRRRYSPVCRTQTPSIISLKQSGG
jgi:hypothetical protein